MAMRPGMLLPWKSLAAATVVTLTMATLPAPAAAATTAEFCRTTDPASQPIVDQLNAKLQHRVGTMGRGAHQPGLGRPRSGDHLRGRGAPAYAERQHRQSPIVSALSLQSHLWGQTLSGPERALSRRAITLSDNDATVRLWEHLGRRFGLTRFLRSLGLSETVAGPSTHWGNTRVTAADQLTLLQDLLDSTGPIDAGTRRVGGAAELRCCRSGCRRGGVAMVSVTTVAAASDFQGGSVPGRIAIAHLLQPTFSVA
jgi:Beta-lactamase enzyme family